MIRFLIDTNQFNEWYWSWGLHSSPLCLVPSPIAVCLLWSGREPHYLSALRCSWHRLVLRLMNGVGGCWQFDSTATHKNVGNMFFQHFHDIQRPLFRVLCRLSIFSILKSSHLKHIRLKTVFPHQSAPSVGGGGAATRLQSWRNLKSNNTWRSSSGSLTRTGENVHIKKKKRKSSTEGPSCMYVCMYGKSLNTLSHLALILQCVF